MANNLKKYYIYVAYKCDSLFSSLIEEINNLNALLN